MGTTSIDLSDVVAGDMGESYTIIRSTGVFQRGGWTINSTTNVPGFGIVSVAQPEDLEMIPEMDRITGAMVFHSVDRLYLTELDQGGFGAGGFGQDGYGSVAQRFTDIIVWNNLQWRVMHVSPYPNRGFWKSVAIRLQGN